MYLLNVFLSFFSESDWDTDNTSPTKMTNPLPEIAETETGEQVNL